VPGAHCAVCLGKVEAAVAALPEVAAARLNLTAHKLSVTFRGGRADPGHVLRVLDALGYPATPYDPGLAQHQHDREGRRLILALAVAGFAVMNTMMFSVPLWAGLFGQELGPGARTLMMWLSGAVALPCALFAGLPFFQSAWRSLRARRANMDVPISLGVLLGTVFWQGMQAAGGFYVRHSLRNASDVYGFFAIVIGLLSFLFLAAQLTLLAAEVNVVRHYRLWPRSLMQPPLTLADRATFERLALMEERRPEVRVTIGFTPEADRQPLAERTSSDPPSGNGDAQASGDAASRAIPRSP